MTRIDRRFCAVPHTGNPDGVWVRGQETTVEVVTTSNGTLVVKLRCDTCRNLTGALPRQVVWEWLDPFGPVLFRVNDSGQECVVEGCASHLIEWHHFAPRNTFGRQADSWPVLPLCREHHVEWHQRMDGYRWHRAGEVA